MSCILALTAEVRPISCRPPSSCLAHVSLSTQVTNRILNTRSQCRVCVPRPRCNQGEVHTRVCCLTNGLSPFLIILGLTMVVQLCAEFGRASAPTLRYCRIAKSPDPSRGPQLITGALRSRRPQVECLPGLTQYGGRFPTLAYPGTRRHRTGGDRHQQAHP